ASLEPEVVKLVRQIAEALIHREVQTDPELIHRTVRKALSAILDRERLVVRVNPVDLEALRSNKVALLDEFDGVEVLDVEADPSIAPGGCVVDSELMHVDARIKTQLKRVLAALADPSAEIGAGEA
ncbi:MAG: flagellar assembly protein FliH, partial [Candidatus Hydrogenedentes bacterium]|nr:flagellar assembly protein FliH [Candidatus Hydrogenedentota bacterium]